MRTQSLKANLIMSVIFTIVVVGFVSFTSSEDITALGFVLNAAVIFVIVFTTMRLTNRVTAFMVNRFGPQGSSEHIAMPPPEPSSSRPEHAQRRRQRRRQRGRRRSGE